MNSILRGGSDAPPLFSHQPIMAIDNPFQNTLKDVEMYSEILKTIGEMALQLGHPEDGLSITSAFMKCKKAIRESIELEEKANGLGYSSVHHALKALSQTKTKPLGAYPEDFPEQFKRVPQIWLDGRPDTRQTAGFKPLTMRAALREHRVMMPLLIEAWELSEGAEGREQMLRGYLTTSSEEFTQELYKFIHLFEEDALEVQLVEEVQKRVQMEKYEDMIDGVKWRRKKKGRMA